MEAEAFDSWAIVEVMGHQSYAGRVTEQVVAATPFLRVDVPETEHRAAFTKLIGPGSVYAITPVEESVARLVAPRSSDPVTVYVPELRRREQAAREMAPALPAPADDDDDEDDYYPEGHNWDGE